MSESIIGQCSVLALHFLRGDAVFALHTKRPIIPVRLRPKPPMIAMRDHVGGGGSGAVAAQIAEKVLLPFRPVGTARRQAVGAFRVAISAGAAKAEIT